MRSTPPPQAPRSRSHDPPSRSQQPAPPESLLDSSTSSFLTYPVSHVASALYRRLTEPHAPSPTAAMHKHSQSGAGMISKHPISNSNGNANGDGMFHAPKRTPSPFVPPPLTGLSLRGHRSPRHQILARTLAEEIRLLLPPRLQLSTEWTLAYSVETDGVSLATLYSKCEWFAGNRHGFVLVVKDSLGGIFGAYLTDPPHPSPHYFGTGECFLWRATVLPASAILANLPPPPSADTSHLQRSTTILSGSHQSYDRDLLSPWTPKSPPPASPTSPSETIHPSRSPNNNSPSNVTSPTSPSSATTLTENDTDIQDRIRFKAFPYSGVNDYMIFCEAGYLSVGGGDGHYGLWLDSVLERGVSQGCPTFGNEALSEEGEKFEVVGVEIWFVGS